MRAALARLFTSFTVSIPKEGHATITPKRRPGSTTIEYDVTDPHNPKVQVLSPSRVSLDLNNQAMALPT